jgi:hypothetical protein
MSAPTKAHERRRFFLSSLADLMGCTARLPIDERRRPDVVQIDTRRGWLFVGDAKATEEPSNRETAIRLRRYSRSAAKWAACRFVIVFAICHGHASMSAAWAQLILEVTRGAGLTPRHAGGATFDDETAITWVFATAVEQQGSPRASALSDGR